MTHIHNSNPLCITNEKNKKNDLTLNSFFESKSTILINKKKLFQKKFQICI